ncbi:MAG: phage baseplate assembly protein V [Saprospiraceae bacterium]
MPDSEKLIVKLSVRISGQDREYAVSSLFLSQAIGTHHHFNIELRGEELDDSIVTELKSQLGKPLDIKFYKGNSVDLKFKGIITGINLSNDSDDHKTMTLSGNSPTIRMDDGKNSRCFKEITYKRIIDKITEPYKGLKFTAKGNSSNSQLPIFIQYKESNFNLLLRVCELAGLWVYYDGQEVKIGDQPTGKSKDIIVGQSGGHYQIEANLIPANLEYRTYDYTHDKVYSLKTKAEADDKNLLVKSVVNASKELFNSNTISPSLEFFSTDADFTKYGDTMQNTYISGSVRISGSSTDPTLSIGDTINLIEKKDGNQSSIGHFFVVQIQHNSSVSGYYQNQFEAIPKDVKTPPLNTNIYYPKGEDQTATVIDNQDPEKLGRVKIQFIWQDDANDSNWMRVLAPMGGKDHGFYYVPEVKDHVLIGFELDNPNRPYVKGSFFNNSQKADQLNQILETSASKVQSFIQGKTQEAAKGFFTKSGNQIITTQQGVFIMTKGGKSIVSVLTNEDGMVYIMANDKIFLSSGKEIAIESGEKISLKAKEIVIDAEQKLELKGGSEVNVSGGSVVEVKGKMIKLN